VKEKFKDASLVNWFFDVYLGNLPIWKTETYFSTLKLFDYYFCSLKGVADKLKEKGFTNVHHLGEACFPLLHSPQYMNNFQKNKYGSDVAFCGSVGFKLQHPNRIPILKRICEEGFDIKIWGNLVGSKASIPSEIKSVYKGMPAINDVHSMVCQSSLINLGIDQMPDLDMSFSARVYRILCAGGLYLSTATKGLDKIFEINKEGESIKPTQDLVVFYDEDDLIKKLDFLLEHEQIRKSIAENGRKKVQDITFEKRIKEMLEVVKK
jgi:spore maturation protein CgeB